MEVFVFYKSSKQNEELKCIEATVIEVGEHIFKCTRSNRGPPITVSPDYIRIKPQGNNFSNS